MKYIRLLRLQDQYILLSSVIISALYLHMRGWWVLSWAAAMLFFSFTAFIINELVDREDTDKYSWNPIHIKKDDLLNPTIVGAMFLIFTVLGLYLSYINKLFWFGLLIYLIGLVYSLKPIRLKSRFGFDVLAQISVWFVLPILGPIWLNGRLMDVLPFIPPAICIVWGMLYPYQLADFIADSKAGIKGTHVVLGMKTSLVLGLILTLIGTVLFFTTRLFEVVPWSWPFLLISLYTFYCYFIWLRISSLKNQTRSIQEYVIMIKRVGYFFVPYLLFWLFI